MNSLDLKQIAWFSSVGETLDGFEKVKSWEEAIERSSSLEWENHSLDVRGDITSYLSQNHRDAYQLWNGRAKEIKGFLEDEVFPVINAKIVGQQGSHEIMTNVEWDLLNILMVDSYKDLLSQPNEFYRQLYLVYESGHYPCGISNGKIVIF